MDKVIISKEKLLVKLSENRELHREQFEEALLGWKDRVLEELEESLDNARKGTKFNTQIMLPRPMDHTPEYDAVIDQVSWNELDQIELDLHSFNQFVRDDWGWKSDFLSNAVMYTRKVQLQ